MFSRKPLDKTIKNVEVRLLSVLNDRGVKLLNIFFHAFVFHRFIEVGESSHSLILNWALGLIFQSDLLPRGDHHLHYTF